MDRRYLSCAVLACFEGENVDGASPLPPDASSPAIAAAQQAAAAGSLTQELFNKALAEDRRKHQAKLEKTIEEVQAHANLTAAERNNWPNSWKVCGVKAARRKPSWRTSGSNWSRSTRRN